MSNVIDMFTRKRIGTKQDTKANDLTAGKGVYAGNIGRTNAAAFHSTLGIFENTIQRLADIQEEFEEVAGMHIANIERIAAMLAIGGEHFDIEEQELMVSEEGHVWVVPFGDEEE